MTNGASSANVVIVEDQDGTRHVLSSWLRRAGYTVHEASTGTEALELMARQSVQLVLLDMHLPDMSGMEVCERIKSGRATSAIPVLHLSASATGTNDRIEALNRGADGYLIEPIERDELLANVAALLRYHEARRTATNLASTLERLHQATLLMNAATNTEELMQAAATGLVAVFGRTAAVIVLQEGAGLAAVAAVNVPDATITTHSADTVLELCRAAYFEQPLPDETLRAITGDEDFAAGVPVAPLITPRGELMGALLLAGTEAPADSLMLDHVGQAFAVAFENQRLYAVEHTIALALQRAMLPATLPQPAGLQVAVSYHAASDTAEVGGDFYDVVQRDEHTTLVAVGDVAGHSLHAATVMAELRHALRALAGLGLSIAEIFQRLDANLIEAHPTLTATLAVAEIDTRTDEVRISNAGQVPPILSYPAAAGGRTAEAVEEHGVLLGVPSARALSRPVTQHPFPPGATLVLSTDGLVERRRENLRSGIERFRSAVGAHTGSMAALCENLIATVGEGSFDDIAIVAIHREDSVSVARVGS